MKQNNLKIIDNKKYKICKSSDYNFIFNKENGFFARWGKTQEEDPQCAPFPEILDLEISTGKCSGKCKFCSPKGTLINTPYGEVSIEKIKKGDFILGYDIKNKKNRINKVEETYSRDYDGDLICFEIDNKKVLKLTPEHIVILKNGIEKQAKDINKNDEIIFF